MLIEKWERYVNKRFAEEQMSWPTDLRKILNFISRQGNKTMNVDLWQEKRCKKTLYCNREVREREFSYL